jgi:hypothetical protein
MASRLAPSRRALLTGMAVAAAAGCAPAGLALAAPARARAVVSFHMDQPFLDLSGRGAPYVPAAGAAVELPESLFLHYPYI